MRTRSKTLPTVLVRALTLAVTGGAVWVVGRGLDWGALATELRSARWQFLVLTSCLAVGHLFLRGIGWGVILGPVPGGSTVKMVRYTVAGAAASLLAPFRTAEALRPWLLRRNHGVPLVQSAGVFLADKAVEGLGLGLLALPLPILGRHLGRHLPVTSLRAAVIVAAAAAGILAGALFLRRLFFPQAGRGPFVSGLGLFRDPRRFFLALGISLAAWLLDLAAIGTTFSALHIPGGFADLLVLLLSVNAALLLPSAPGNVGSLELGATLGAAYLGIPHTRAVAFALVYHAAQLAPLIAIGAGGLVHALLRREGALHPRTVGLPPGA